MQIAVAQARSLAVWQPGWQGATQVSFCVNHACRLPESSLALRSAISGAQVNSSHTN